MGTTDEPEKILAVLNNILETENTDSEGGAQYLLGDITGLSEIAELKIIKKLHDEKTLSVKSYLRSDGTSYNIEDDFTKIRRLNPNYRFITDAPVSRFIITKPVSATLLFEKKKLEKKKDSIKISRQRTGKNKTLEKDENGDFLIKDKFLMIGGKPLSHDALHYKVLDILYENSDQNGKVGLNIMQKELLKQDKNPEYQDSGKLKKAVDNAILNLFRRTKIGSGQLKKILPNRKRMIDTYEERSRFAGWVLNNPTV